MKLTRCGVLAISGLFAATVASPTDFGVAASPRVLLVCNGTAGFTCPAGAAAPGYATIQDAVDAARPGDWILVWPGDYREHGHDDANHPAGVWITMPGIFVRGMDRNLVVVDGTKSGPECSTAAGDQNYGVVNPATGAPSGRDGVVVWKTDGTWLENFTACNFLTSADGGHGNEIWWNGGDGSGQIGMHSYWGDYLTATSTYATTDSAHPEGGDNPRGEYGIFSSNVGNGSSRYSGFMDHGYANNMGDAAFYIGACPNCSQVLENSHGQNSALGFSGTNAGGNLIISDTEFDHNKTGLTANSQNNDDQPSPQSGLCPAGYAPPLTGAAGCTVFENNRIRDNNNPNVPGVGQGLSGGAPVGTGVVLAGTRFITLYRNQIENNAAWGALITDLPDPEQAPNGFPNCTGGTWLDVLQICWYQAYGNATIDNVFAANGGYGNPTNGDVGLIEPLTPPDDPLAAGNCFHGNRHPGLAHGYLKSDPPAFPASETPSNYLQQPATYGTCGVPNSGNADPVLFGEAACDSQLLAPCPSGLPVANYPRPTQVHLMSQAETAAQSPTMTNPCGKDSFGESPPPNPWCPYAGPTSSASPDLVAALSPSVDSMARRLN